MNINKIGVISVNKFSSKFGAAQTPKMKRTDSSVEHSSYWNLLHIAGILTGCALVLSPQTLIPRHNSIIYQQYWFELNIPVTVVFLMTSANRISDCYIFTKCKQLISIQVFLKMCFWNLLGWLLPYFMCYLVWSIIMGYNHPMPFVYCICAFVEWIFELIGVWYLFPVDQWTRNESRLNLKIYLLYSIWWYIVGIQNILLSFVFENLPLDLQWTVAFLIPAARESNKFVFSKLVYRMVEHEDEAVHSTMKILVNVHYAIFIAIRLVGAELITVYAIVATDFIFHLMLTCQIIQLHRKVNLNDDGSENIKERTQNAITKLVLAETIEGFAPLAYGIGFAMAFYGPNARITGNVQNGYWGYEAVEDVNWLFTELFFMFSLDTVSILLNALILWRFGKINLIQEFCTVIEKLWPNILLKLAMVVAIIFCSNDINGGYDFTAQFEWITREGRYKMLINTTDLSDEDKIALLFNITLK